MWPRPRAWALALALTLGASPGVWADQPERELPDYDGREEPPPTAGDVLLWVPRVVFFPVYLATEYLVRWPLATFLTWAEREAIFERLAGVFTFGSGGRAGLVPTFLLDFGFRPSVGLYFWATELYGASDSFGLHLAFGGERWWRLSVRQRFQFGGQEPAAPDPDQAEVPMSGSETGLEGARRELAFHFLLDYKPDFLFHGLGPEAPTLPTRYERRHLGGTVRYSEHFSSLSELNLTAQVGRNEFHEGDADGTDGEVNISDAFDVGDEAVVPGFGGYVLGLVGVAIGLDSRRPRPAPGSGARFAGWADLGTDLGNSDASFLRYGGEATFFVDLSGRQQVLALRQWVGLIEELGDDPTPFHEQYAVGGGALLRGLLEGRYRGLSGTVTSLSYTYPVWVFLDGYLGVDVGNAWGANLSGFDVEKMAASFVVGIRSSTARDNVFNLLFGFGTTPFDAAEFGVETFRLVFGTTAGF